MLSILSWLVAGATVGLAVRALAPSRRFFDIFLAAALGVSGALLGGLFRVALAGPDDATGDRELVNGLSAAVGALLVPWAYLAYSTRWEARAADETSPASPATTHPTTVQPGSAPVRGAASTA